MSQEAVYNKFGEFIVLDQKKTSCGKRLIARDDMLRQKSVTTSPN